MTFRVLGIDPGLNVTGYAVVDFRRDGRQIVEAGTLRTAGRADLAERIRQIYDDLRASWRRRSRTWPPSSSSTPTTPTPARRSSWPMPAGR